MTWILAAALAASILLVDPLGGLAVVALGSVFLLLRGTGDPGILMFCLTYQWAFIVTGFVHLDLMGTYPGNLTLGSLEFAVVLLLGSLVCIAAGLRTGILTCERLSGQVVSRLAARPANYDVNKLFAIVVVLFSASWVVGSSPRAIAYSISQILSAGLEFRFVFLYALFLSVARQGQGYGRAAGALLFALVPTFVSGMSVFKDLLFMFLLAIINEMSHRVATTGVTPKLKRMLMGAACGAVLIVPLGLIWQGAIKPAWRPQALDTKAEASPMAKIGAFFTTALQAVGEMDWGKSISSLAERLSGSPQLFSLVVRRVPAEVPHEGGALTWRGIRHILTPRFLFPDKENLGSDSWLVRKFAGVAAAGEESNTSIGLSYLAEFYIDFGPIGMPIATFFFGMALGMGYRALALAAPSLPLYYGAAAIIMIRLFMGLESNFAKLLGALVMSFIVFALLLRLFGPWLHKTLQLPTTNRLGPPRRRGPPLGIA
ncbi:MAG TPA: hypothetical protein VG826_13135 [Pirellulales bacterium]|nr:hypothetical protein [Pirellulales bacterium]